VLIEKEENKYVPPSYPILSIFIFWGTWTFKLIESTASYPVGIGIVCVPF